MAKYFMQHSSFIHTSLKNKRQKDDSRKVRGTAGRLAYWIVDPNSFLISISCDYIYFYGAHQRGLELHFFP